MYTISCILPYTAFCSPIRLIWCSIDLYDIMSHHVPFYILPLLASQYVCLILTPWVSYSQHIHVVPVCFLFLGTKYSYNIFLNLTFFGFFNILFDLYDSHYQVSKFLKYASLYRLGNEISYHAIWGASLYIQFLLTNIDRNKK